MCDIYGLQRIWPWPSLTVAFNPLLSICDEPLRELRIMWNANEPMIPFPKPMPYGNAPGLESATRLPNGPMRMAMPEPQHFQFEVTSYDAPVTYPYSSPSPGMRPANSAPLASYAFQPNHDVWAANPGPWPSESFGPRLPSPQPPMPPNARSPRSRTPSSSYAPPFRGRVPSTSSSTSARQGRESQATNTPSTTSRHSYNNLPRAVDELETFKKVLELLGDDMSSWKEMESDAKLGLQLQRKMTEMKTASSLAVSSARDLCNSYETFASKVIKELQSRSQSGFCRALLPNAELDGMWSRNAELSESTKTSVASVFRCTYELKSLSDEADERFGKQTMAKRFSNWFANHGHLWKKGDSAGTSTQGSSSRTQSVDSTMFNQELPTYLKQIQISLTNLNTHRVMQHEDLRSKLEEFKKDMTAEVARRALRDWEVLSSSFTR
ncbi:hypothetical protein SCHPADRAFT_939878 [Schizopora paradoxa]|uniref:Uncharacterized protein n=1 Tax=Schizopora paradoxa TaxID=27342 RepID=A0A0H2RX57_9AGAM|nr:hypothetical protein SCHPADRAFT_939878 [Schizopora paradoxa]